jgi:hypothetical protein
MLMQHVTSNSKQYNCRILLLLFIFYTYKGKVEKNVNEKRNFTYSHANKKLFFGRTFQGMDRGASY